MKNLFVIVLAVITRLPSISCQTDKATYIIVAPTVVRPNTDYLVAVSAFNIGRYPRVSGHLRIRPEGHKTFLSFHGEAVDGPWHFSVEPNFQENRNGFTLFKG